MSISPFTLQRFEYIHKNYYYVSPNILSKLISCKPVFIIGSRGTGKTTLLKYLDWNERVSNEYLKDEIGLNNIFESNFIGIYIRMADFNTISLEKWTSNSSDEVKGLIFSFYIDLIWIEALCHAISLSLNDGILDVTPTNETLFFQDVKSEYPELFLDYSSNSETCTFKSFKSIINRIRTDIALASIESNLLPGILINKYRITEYFKLGKFFSKLITDFIDKHNTYLKDHFHIKVCFDETECLSEFQRLVLNTSIRLSNKDIIVLASYVDSLVDVNKTLIPSLSLGDPDREIINLDLMTDKDFKDLIKGVTNVRISAMIKEKKEYDINQRLGVLNINKLLTQIIKSSENISKVNEFYSMVKAYLESLNNKISELDFEKLSKSNEILPFYEAYLHNKLQLSLINKTKKEIRMIKSQKIRKKMVAAYLCICNEFKKDIRYAYSNMLLQMSDKCIRDYLNQMDSIFIETKKDINEFLSYNIPIEIQDKALKLASKNKYDGIPKADIKYISQTERIVNGLAQITAYIQKHGDNNAPLISNEKGIFIIGLKMVSEEDKYIIDLLKETAEAGYFKILYKDDQKIEFRIHSSLAAYFGFSYRGSYYKVKISFEDLKQIIKAEESIKINTIIKRLSNELANKESNDITSDLELSDLFIGKNYDN